MTDFEDRLEREVEDLKRVRDELRVRMHLAKADAKDLWDKLEHKLDEVEGRLRRVRNEAQEPIDNVGAAARQLVEEIREGYRRIRQAL